jgi:hypothetical protein
MKNGSVSKPISRSMVRKATATVVRDVKTSNAPLRLTPGQRKHITKSS